MIDIFYTLHTDDGQSLQEEVRQSPHVPRIGELVTVTSQQRSYQIVDVLWHINPSGNHHVTITACELNWHKHIQKVTTTEWSANHESR